MGGSAEAWYLVSDAARIATPALLVYRERLERNIGKALEIAGGPRRLRPHVKTHKSSAVVELMLAAGITRFKCATVAEAEMLGRARAEDVLLAYPLLGEHARRFARLCESYPRTRFSTIADSAVLARSLSAALAERGQLALVLLDLDVGMHRTGIGIGAEAVELYRELAVLPAVRPGGLHCYDGHNHERDPSARARLAATCRDDAMRLKAELERLGLDVPSLVMGGTPTFPCYAAYPEAELSPGTCFFHDWGYLRDYPDLPFEPAALLITRVVSRPGPGRLTLDCGYKAIAADQPGERGLPLNLADARSVSQSEEHWVLESPAADTLSVGSELYVLPTHICPTFALHREALVVDGEGRVADRWQVTARDRSIGI